MTSNEALTDLVERLERARDNLRANANHLSGYEHARMAGKAEGVELALGYVREALALVDPLPEVRFATTADIKRLRAEFNDRLETYERNEAFRTLLYGPDEE